MCLCLVYVAKRETYRQVVEYFPIDHLLGRRWWSSEQQRSIAIRLAYSRDMQPYCELLLSSILGEKR